VCVFVGTTGQEKELNFLYFFSSHMGYGGYWFFWDSLGLGWKSEKAMKYDQH